MCFVIYLAKIFKMHLNSAEKRKKMHCGSAILTIPLQKRGMHHEDASPSDYKLLF